MLPTVDTEGVSWQLEISASSTVFSTFFSTYEVPSTTPVEQLLRLLVSESIQCRAAKRSKEAGTPPDNPHFQQADLLKPVTKLGERQWDTALDSALLHCFPPAQQHQYLKNLHPLVRSFWRLRLTKSSSCAVAADRMKEVDQPCSSTWRGMHA